MLHRVLPLPLLAALALLASAAEPEAQATPAGAAPPAAQPPAAAPAPAVAEAPPPATPVAPPAAAPPPRVSLFHRRPHGAQPAWVAAANPLAVDAGLEILGKGGNAIDAAVAVQAMLGLVEPQSSGIAGGAFLLHYDAHTRKVSAVDGRERAPAGAQPDMFLDEHGKPLPFVEAVRSGRSTGVPGAIAMLYAAHAKRGALRWKELFQPAIRAASLGFKVPARLALFLGEGPPFPPTNEVRTLFSRPDGETIQEGDLFRNPEYARTLERIALDGARAAAALEWRVSAGNALHTRQDRYRRAPPRGPSGLVPVRAGESAHIRRQRPLRRRSALRAGAGGALARSRLRTAAPAADRPTCRRGAAGGRDLHAARPGCDRRVRGHEPPGGRGCGRQCGLDDHHRGIGVRLRTHGPWFRAQQSAHRLLVRTHGGRPPGRQCGPRRQASALLDGADHRS